MTKFKEAVLCIIKFFLLIGYGSGTIGGLVRTINATAWPLAICIVILAVFGWPTAWKLVSEITEYNATENR